MRRVAAITTLLLFLYVSGDAAPASDESLAGRERAAFAAFHYKTGSIDFPNSHGTYVVPSHAKMVTGPDALLADEIINGTSGSNKDGVVFLKQGLLYLSFVESGFVTLDDWQNLDAAAMLSGIKATTEASNYGRVANGGQSIHVDGWAQMPTVDPARESVRYILALHDGSGRFVNAVALKFGRHGYERFNLVSHACDVATASAILTASLKSYEFDPGYRRSDYLPGDKTTSVGFATLVRTAGLSNRAKTADFGSTSLVKSLIFVFIIVAVAYVQFIRRYGIIWFWPGKVPAARKSGSPIEPGILDYE